MLIPCSVHHVSTSTWLLQVLLTCDRYSDSSNRIQYYCLFTASLWAYAREKLQELGHLCGLMPDQDPTSDQLHRVVELSSGIRDQEASSPSASPVPPPPATAAAAEEPDPSSPMSPTVATVLMGRRGASDKCPVDKLKEALSSKAAFRKYYLVRSIFMRLLDYNMLW